MLKEHSVVLATRNLSRKTLAGCKGIVVFIYNDPRLAYEVEFMDQDGYTLELLTVLPSDIEAI